MRAQLRKRGRVVEGTSLENWRRVTLFVSSNLTASANNSLNVKDFFILLIIPQRGYCLLL
jgi:hypothetical protein